MWLIPGICLVALARMAWRGSAHLYVDFGREAYVAWRLSVGEGLYRDIAWFNGPLSAHANALAFRLFGVSLDTLLAVNLVIVLVVALLLHELLSRSFGRLGAWLGMMTFLLVFAFGQFRFPNFNWLSPYSHELTHGIALALAALLSLSQASRSRGGGWAVLAGALLGLVALTKVEVTLALVCATVAVLVLERDGLARLAPRLGIGLLGTLGVALVLQAWRGAASVWTPIVEPWRLASMGEVRALSFYVRGLGLDHPWSNAFSAIVGFTAIASSVAAATALDAKTEDRPVANFAVSTVVFVTALAGGLAALPFLLSRAFQSLPLMLAAIVGVLLWRSAAPERERKVVGLGLTVFALALLAKMALNARIEQYGFALAMPSTVVLVAFCSDYWVELGRTRWRGTGRPVRMLAVAVTVALWVLSLAVAHRAYSSRAFELGAGRDLLRADERADVLEATLGRVREIGPGSMVVLPEGVMLNYLARVPNPTPYINYIPPELLMFGEGTMVEALERTRPDVILLVHRDGTTYGLRFFGRDFGRLLDRWVRTNYELDSRFGAEPFKGREFGVDVMVPRAR